MCIGFFFFIIALLVCEGLLRILWHNSYATSSVDHVVWLNLQAANLDYHVDRSELYPDTPIIQIRTGPRSYILPAVPFETPNATVAFLGGSTTELWTVQEPLRFPALISTLAAQQGMKINCLNAARSGTTLHDSINILLNHVVLDRPEIVVVMHATNDIGVLNACGGYQLRSGQELNVSDIRRWLKCKLSRHVYLLGLVRKSLSDSRARIQNTDNLRWRNDPNLADKISADLFRQRLFIFIDICKRFNIVPVLVTQPLATIQNELTPEWADLGAQDRFNAIIRQTGEQEGVLVIDLVKHFNEKYPNWNNTFEYFYDGMHVTDKGSKVYAEFITPRLIDVIRTIQEVKLDK